MAMGRVWVGDCGEVEGRGWLFVFFFQAEDGIRDYKVTGVQTCALPISIALSCYICINSKHCNSRIQNRQ